MGSVSSANLYFSGMSNYAQDLNNAISRQVQIASLPIQLLQNDVNDLTSQSSELQTLSGNLLSMQSAISGLSAASTNTTKANVSNPGVASASAAAGAVAGSYSLEVTNLGSYSDALSLDNLAPVANPNSQNLSTSTSYTLTVNGTAIYPPIQPATSNLNGLAKAINAADAGVQATVVNVGSDTAPDYRLSLQSEQYGNVSMQLNDGNQDLLAVTGGPGQSVQYTLNGRSIQSGSRTVTLASGLTATLTATNVGTPATVTVGASTSGIGNSLSTFVSAYNSAINELNRNRGQAGGALTGQSTVYQLTNSLRSLVNYSTGTNGISSLTSIGVTFDDSTGVLSFDPSVLANAANGQMDALTQFLGSATGSGFLQQATNVLSGIEDPTSGTLTQEISSVQAQITATNQQISDKQDQVNTLQQNLTQQMSTADALIYSMQQQATYYTSMFATMQAANNAAAG